MTATQASASQLLTHRERVPSGVGIQCPCGSSLHVMATIRKAFRMEFLERKYGELEFLETGFSFVSKAPFRFRRLPMCLVFRVFPRERVGGRVSEMSGDGGGQRTPAHCSPGCEDLPCGGGTRDPCALLCAPVRSATRGGGQARPGRGQAAVRVLAPLFCRLPWAPHAKPHNSASTERGGGGAGIGEGRGCGERTPQQHPAAEAFTFP